MLFLWFTSFFEKRALLTSSMQFSLRGIDKERLTVFSARAGGTMAEVGLLPLARVALQVATQVLPPYHLSRSRSTPARAPRVARRIAIAGGARLHHAVSFSAAAGGRRRRSRIAGNRASAAAPPAPSRFCRHRRHGALPHFRQHLLPPPSGAACARGPASSSLVEVADCGGCAATDFVGAARPSGARVRRACSAGIARCGGTRCSPRGGAGRCGV